MRRSLAKTLLAIITALITLPSASITWAQELKFERCQISHNAQELDAECALLTRPENPQQPDGKQINLFVTKLASTSPNPAADALTLIQGGPGGSSIDMTIGFKQFVDMVRSKRDVLVLDQRGTGRSNMLQCDIDEQFNDISEFNEEATRAYTKICLEKLKDNALEFYTTSIAVHDLEAMRIAAGYEQLTLYGVSYGTRVAQHYLRRYPASTRAIIIDGVVDVEMSLAGAEIARRSQEAFDSMAQQCAQIPSCKSEFGDIKLKFSELRARLTQSPVELDFAHPNTGKPNNISIKEADLLTTVRLMPYSTEGLALLPMIIAQAHSGNYLPLAAKGIEINESFIQGFATGMHNSVVCAEDAPFVASDAAEKTKDTYFGTTTMDSIRVSCESWPKGVIDADFKNAFDSTKPVLILSGETDPITPPENGARADAMFSNSLHIEVPAHGHGVIGRGCVPFLVKEFIENVDLSALNPSCTERERSMPIFIDATGPKP